ncbi:MAG: hypothetical protein NDJ75_08020, partial [Thermoanaerobaculia bacterium]|nr:hypothetical protein [Thermoanaerobaculia bacterium]
ELPKLLRVEELLAGGGSPGSKDGETTAAARSAPAAAARRASPTPAPVRAAANSPAAPPALSPPPAPTTPPTPPVAVAPPAALAPPVPAATPERAAASADAMARFRDELSARRPTLAASLEKATLRHEGGALVVELPAGDALGAAQLQRNSNRELLGAAAAEAFGAGIRLRVVEARAAAAPSGEAAARPESPLRPLPADDPRVQAVLDIFGGSVAPPIASDDEENA